MFGPCADFLFVPQLSRRQHTFRQKISISLQFKAFLVSVSYDFITTRQSPRKRDAHRVPPLGFPCNAAVENRCRRGFRAERNGNRVVSKAFSSHGVNWACGRGQRRRAIPAGVELRPSAAVAAVTCAISVFAALPYLPVTPGPRYRTGFVRSFYPANSEYVFFHFYSSFVFISAFTCRIPSTGVFRIRFVPRRRFRTGGSDRFFFHSLTDRMFSGSFVKNFLGSNRYIV